MKIATDNVAAMTDGGGFAVSGAAGLPPRRTEVAAMTDGGGIAVTVRCEHRSKNRWAVHRWAVHGADARRIGTVRPVEGSPADWWAVDLDGAVQGRAATFGAAVGMVVDAAIDVDTRGGPAPAGHGWAVHGPPRGVEPGVRAMIRDEITTEILRAQQRHAREAQQRHARDAAWYREYLERQIEDLGEGPHGPPCGVEPGAAVDLELRVAVLKRENAALKHANRGLTSAIEEARAAARSARTVLRTPARGDPEPEPGDRPLPFDRPAKSPRARLMSAAAKARVWRYNRRALCEKLRNRAAAVGVPFAVYVTGVLWRAVRRQEVGAAGAKPDDVGDRPPAPDGGS